jgi:hypothetical protein
MKNAIDWVSRTRPQPFNGPVEAAKHFRPLKKLWVEYLGEHPDAAIDRVEHTTTEAES